MNQRKIGILLNYAERFLHVGISMLYVPLLLKGIGQSEYGLYQLVASLIAYISIMEQILSSGVLRFYCKSYAEGDLIEAENTLAIAQRVYAFLSVVVVCLGILLIVPFDAVYAQSLTQGELREANWLILLLLGNIVINMNGAVYGAAMYAREEFLASKLIAILTIVLQPFAVIALIRFYPYASAIVAVQLIIAALSMLVKRAYCYRKLKVTIRYHHKDIRLLMSVFRFAVVLLLVAIADQIFWKADQLILGKMFGTDIVAVYAVGAQIYLNYSSFGVAVSNVFMPRISKLYAAGDSMQEISDLFIRVGRIAYITLALVLTGFMLFGQEFIAFWAGEEYGMAYYIALVVMMPFTIDIIQNLGLTILQVMDKYAFRAKMYLVMALANIGSTVVLAKLFGPVGAACSTGLAMLIGSGFVLNWYYNRIGLEIKRFWREILHITVPVCITLFVGIFIKKVAIENIYLQFFVHVLFYCAVYGVILYAFGMNAYERGLIKNVVRKIMKGKC